MRRSESPRRPIHSQRYCRILGWPPGTKHSLGCCHGNGCGRWTPQKRGVLYGAVLKFGEIKTGAVKGGLPDPAHSEGTAGEMGKLKIRVVGDTVERHAVKIGLAEKPGGKPALAALS